MTSDGSFQIKPRGFCGLEVFESRIPVTECPEAGSGLSYSLGPRIQLDQNQDPQDTAPGLFGAGLCFSFEWLGYKFFPNFCPDR